MRSSQLTDEILKLPVAFKQAGISRSLGYSKMNPASPYHDDCFPKRVALGDRAVGIRASEMAEWIASRPAI